MLLYGTHYELKNANNRYSYGYARAIPLGNFLSYFLICMIAVYKAHYFNQTSKATSNMCIFHLIIVGISVLQLTIMKLTKVLYLFIS